MNIITKKSVAISFKWVNSNVKINDQSLIIDGHIGMTRARSTPVDKEISLAMSFPARTIAAAVIARRAQRLNKSHCPPSLADAERVLA